MSLARHCGNILKRQLTLAFRRPIEIANPLLFFAIVVSLFPLGIGPQTERLSELAPGILWVVALLANLLTADSLFRSDYDDGSLEQLLLAPYPLYFSVLAYVFAQWLVTGLLLTLVSPVFAVMLSLPGTAYLALLASLLLGTGVLSLIGGIGVALTVGLRRGGMLIALLVLPMYVPVLIFGSAAVRAATSGTPVGAYLGLLGALLSLGLALAPFAIASGLRISVDG